MWGGSESRRELRGTPCWKGLEAIEGGAGEGGEREEGEGAGWEEVRHQSDGCGTCDSSTSGRVRVDDGSNIARHQEESEAPMGRLLCHDR